MHLARVIRGICAAVSTTDAWLLWPCDPGPTGHQIRDLRLTANWQASPVNSAPDRCGASVRNDLAMGAITIGAQPPGGFSDSQIELLKTFAEQAVIAITSAETYRQLEERTAALATRNSEYSEQIEQQLATIDVLKAMSAALSDTQPVFDLIRLGLANYAALWLPCCMNSMANACTFDRGVDGTRQRPKIIFDSSRCVPIAARQSAAQPWNAAPSILGTSTRTQRSPRRCERWGCDQPW